MKKFFISILLFVILLQLAGQQGAGALMGTVSFISSQNVYVKFQGTSTIHPGDTLYKEGPGRGIPALRVKSTSAISCICAPAGGYQPATGDVIFHYSKQHTDEDARDRNNIVKRNNVNGRLQLQKDRDTAGVKGKQDRTRKFSPAFRGKFAVNAYSGFSEHQDRNYLRMRYRLSLDASHIGGSGVSAETYLTFNHRDGEWNEIQSNPFNGLKIYNLNVQFEATPSTKFLLGRAINRQLTNIGAIDGFQISQDFGNFTVGGIAGARPDHEDYGFNTRLLQYGGYISHAMKINNRNFRSSVAFMEQMNSGLTDRRFLYIQHSSSLIRNLYLFSSFDINLYEVRDSVAQNTFNLTSLYILLRYNILEDLSVTASWDLRNNVIYYETYRNYIDRLIEEETRQGLNISFRYHLFDFVTVGMRGSYRYRKDDPLPAGNYSAYLYFNRLPAEGLRIHLNSNLIGTSYLSGTMYGIRLNQEIIPGKLNGGIHYRIFDGIYRASDTKTLHHITELQVRWNIYRKLSAAVSYEAMFENSILNNRLYLVVSQRF